MVNSGLRCMASGSVVLSVLALLAGPAPGQATSSGVTWEAPVEVASGAGYRGPWRMNESDFDYVDDPTVAIDEAGTVGVAWADQSVQDIFLQIYEPDGSERFDAPVNVSRSPHIFSWLPRLLISPDDAREVYVLWQEIVFSGGSHGGEIFFARSTDGGKSFGDPINLSNTMAGAGKGRLTARRWDNGSLDLAMGAPSDLHAAWTEYEGRLWFSRSTDAGESFFEPLHVAGGDAAPARGPSLAVDPREGTVYLAWTVGDDRAADIHLARSVDGGRSFAEPQIVLARDGHADAPKIAVDREGSLHLVYAESPAGPFERYHVRYTRSSDGGRSFEEPREISRGQAEQVESASFPALSLDGEDNLYVVWEVFPQRGSHSRGLGFTHFSDGGRIFAPPSIVPGTADPELGVNGSQQGLLMRKLAVNRAGALALVNSTFARNETSHVWLLRGHAEAR